ncbi:hypothetical protein PRZ48_003648 [Zasmidium cellare]|uniref:GH18 domain-containing protein n=1 Tax=Zasmidium cellare TaxID=395010 RepID=A0ABR0EWX5_ZASCE|nr:hypothetical protein PRZ48_003648 [Zasmidium cellare]
MKASPRWPQVAVLVLSLGVLALFSQSLSRSPQYQPANSQKFVSARDSFDLIRRAATIPPTQQNPNIDPPVPIISLSSDYISNITASKTQSSRRALNSNGAEEGFGLCKIVPPPSCAYGGGTTNGRTIGYYQASNTYNRVCNKISPSQIITSNYTHLYFAFASLDPSSYAVTPANSQDVPLYKQFTALKNSKLQTWIAIGGFDFSDPGTSSFTTWSNLTSTSSNRAKFISSLQSFMSQYGFQGVDLDWEYPSTPERGGQRADM